MALNEDGDDPLVIAQWVEIERDGGAMRAYYAEPREARATTPSIVMAMHL